MKYEKRPTTIDAVQWTGDNYDEMVEFVGEEMEIKLSSPPMLVLPRMFKQPLVDVGDFVVKGIGIYRIAENEFLRDWKEKKHLTYKTE